MTMDHRDLYKSVVSNSSSNNRSAKARDLLERRARQRHDIHAAQRCISEEPPAAGSSSSNAAVSSAPPQSAAALSQSAVAKLSKQQRHHLKYIAWMEQKSRTKQSKQLTTAAKRPFTSAVPANRFVGPRSDHQIVAAVAAMPRSQHFRPPANLPSLTLAAFATGRPLNQPIVTRSMAVKAQQQTKTSAFVDPVKPRITSAPPTKRPAALLPFKKPPPVAKAPAKKPLPVKPTAAAKPTSSSGRGVRNLRPGTVRPQPHHLLAAPRQPAKSSARVAAVAGQPPSTPLTDTTTDIDTTAVGAPFTADGSMITSTVQKQHTRRGGSSTSTTISASDVARANEPCASSHHSMLDVFSPIEPIEAGPATTTTTTQPHPKPAAVVDMNVTPVRAPPSSDTDDAINYVSPFVSTARGKVSARKERKQRESVYKLDLNRSLEPAGAAEPVETRQRREAARYFRRKVAAETERLGALASDWLRYKTDNSGQLASVYADLIDVTTGQTRLLLAKKFEQFRGLCDRCEQGDGELPVLAHDLEGFWSMVYMQVENCDARFERLQQLRSNDWTEAEEVEKGGEATVTATTAAVVQRKRPKAKPKTVRGANPFLEQLKKANRHRLMAEQQQQQKEQQNEQEVSSNGGPTAAAAASRAQKTPRKSMLSSVLCHEAHKSMLLGGKSPRKSLAPVVVASAQATTARSILKTPAVKNAASRRGVAFAVTDDDDDDGPASPQSPLRRGTRNALRFVCTPMPKAGADDATDAENRSPVQQRRQTFQVTTTPGILERTAEPVQRAADRFSLLDSPVVGLKGLTLNERGASSRRQH